MAQTNIQNTLRGESRSTLTIKGWKPRRGRNDKTAQQGLHISILRMFEGVNKETPFIQK